MTQWSRIRALASALSSNNLGQVVHTHVPLSPVQRYNLVLADSGDALRLGRYSNCRPRGKSAYRRLDDLKVVSGLTACSTGPVH